MAVAKCTQCGANLEIDGVKKNNKCQYCGANYIKEEKGSPKGFIEVNSLDWINVNEFISAISLLKKQRAEEKYFETAALKETERVLIKEAELAKNLDLEEFDIPANYEIRKGMETWVRHIRRTRNYEEIPLELRNAYEADVGHTGFDPDIYMLYCPSSERAGVKLSQKLLYIFNSSLVCIEKGYNNVTLKKFRAAGLEAIEIGCILLDAWITVAGKNGDKSENFTVYYNAVNRHLFEKIVEMLRVMALELEYPAKYDTAISYSMQDKDFGFMNYTRNIIFENEKPVEYVFQPSITNKRVKTVLTSDHMLLLTKTEVIQITKGRLNRNEDNVLYGHTIAFYVRKCINNPKYAINEKSDRLNLKLSSGAYSSDVLFDKDNITNVITLISKFEKA